MLKVKLSRNLRRAVLRGHPWIFRESLASVPPAKTAQLCQVTDAKGDLAWAMYDPHGPLALRIVSLDKSPPNPAVFRERLAKAFDLRKAVSINGTNAYRLINGEGDLLPGLVCDVYDKLAVVQFDGTGPSEFWDKNLIGSWILENTSCETVVEKSRRGSGLRDSGAQLEVLGGKAFRGIITIRENESLFQVDVEKGQKTGFFLDQRDNRHFIRQMSGGKTVLNLFSYSGGFSVSSGLGGAKKVASVDVAQGAVSLAEENWALNRLHPQNHKGVCADVFEYLNQKGGELWDIVIVDPPSMSHSENQKEVAIAKYIELFGAAAHRVREHGELSMSSCSSHVTFEDFFEIISEALSSSRRRGRILRVSGQGIDHPFPHSAHELRYLKFVHLVLD